MYNIPIKARLQDGTKHVQFVGFASYSFEDDLEVEIKIPLEEAGEMRSLYQVVPLKKIPIRYREELLLLYKTNGYQKHEEREKQRKQEAIVRLVGDKIQRRKSYENYSSGV